ncbi:tyrosine-type recombinase/integrase [Catenulispora subtropica]|uniref:Tyr recombinase domain-containing protein n=1 Tax=Catenulispora subtropica TaxID=450798 RepID=A0ABP5CFK0_9ACTN
MAWSRGTRSPRIRSPGPASTPTTRPPSACPAPRPPRCPRRHRPAREAHRRAHRGVARLRPQVAEVIAADVADLSYDTGHRVLALAGKGGKKHAAVIAPGIGRDLDAYLAGRTDGPLFATAAGRHLDQAAVWRLIRRIAAAAGITAWDRISPHSARHTAITLALDNGAALHDVQDMAGHADPRTIRRYDRRRGHLDRSPSYRIVATLGGDA